MAVRGADNVAAPRSAVSAITNVTGGNIASLGAGASSGSSTQNVAPPKMLGELTPMRPPMSSVSPRQMDRPRPVPPNRRVVDESACVKGVKRRAATPSGTPEPLSSTSMRTATRFDAPGDVCGVVAARGEVLATSAGEVRLPDEGARTRSRRTLTRPARPSLPENLTAFDRRLRAICSVKKERRGSAADHQILTRPGYLPGIAAQGLQRPRRARQGRARASARRGARPPLFAAARRPAEVGRGGAAGCARAPCGPPLPAGTEVQGE